MPIFIFSPDAGGLLSLLVTLVLPILVGLVTRSSTPSSVKATLLLFLAALAAVVESAIAAQQDGVAFQVWPAVMNAFINFAFAVAFYFGLLRPTGVTAAAQRVLVRD